MAEDEDIGLEALQAQVDMSMAFTQSLVSSWLKPTEGKLPSSKARGSQERELEEYMRRPPRLGVGAAISESTSLLSRDSARLKSKLSASAGKKRTREEDVPVDTLLSDHEEESKASVIKKKAKVDPFAPKEKNRKRVPDTSKALTEHPGFQKLSSDTNADVTTPGPSETPLPDEDGRHDADSSTNPLSVKKKKKKKKKGLQLTSPLVIERPKSPSSAQPLERLNASTSYSGVEAPEGPRTSPKTEPVTAALPLFPAKLPPSPREPRSSTPIPRSPASGTPPTKSARTPTIPLLNLNGPPQEAEAISTSPSKKRRRRKKKKRKAVSHAEEEAPLEEDDSDGSD